MVARRSPATRMRRGLRSSMDPNARSQAASASMPCCGWRAACCRWWPSSPARTSARPGPAPRSSPAPPCSYLGACFAAWLVMAYNSLIELRQRVRQGLGQRRCPAQAPWRPHPRAGRRGRRAMQRHEQGAHPRPPRPAAQPGHDHPCPGSPVPDAQACAPRCCGAHNVRTPPRAERRPHLHRPRAHALATARSASPSRAAKFQRHR